MQARAEEKAAFSNHGKWVKAWAPGVDHASDYPDGVEFVYGPDQDDPNSPRASFDGFAKWSGTSFAAPYVAAELIRCAVAWDSSPLDAWRELLKKNQGEVRFPLDEPCGNGTPDAAD